MAKLRMPNNPGYEDLQIDLESVTKEELARKFNQLLIVLGQRYRDILDDNLEGRRKRVSTATNYSATKRDTYVGVTNTDAQRTITLPVGTDAGNNHAIEIKDESGGAGTNSIVVDGNGSETVDGATNYTININYGSVVVMWNGAGWEVVSTSREQAKTSELNADGNLAMGSNKITGLADGTASGDAMHAGQVDGSTIGLNGSNQLEAKDDGLAVSGTTSKDIPKFNSGDGMPGAMYESAWTACSTGGTYAVTHNLGTVGLLVTVLVASDASGTGCRVANIDVMSGPQEYGCQVKSITTNGLTVQFGANSIAIDLDSSGNRDSTVASGYFKVIAIRPN